MLDIVSKYGIDPSELMVPAGLTKLTEIFVNEVNALSEQYVSTQDREKEIRESILKDNPDLYVWTAERFKLVRSAVAEILSDSDESAILLFVLLQELKSEVGDYRDYVISTKARSERKAPTNESEVEEAKNNLSELREAIVSVWTLLGKPDNVYNLDGEVKTTLTKEELKQDYVTVFATKTGKNGDVSPDLPRIPSGPKSGNVGRGAKTRQMQFKVNGENVPEKFLFRDVVYELINDIAAGISYTTKDIIEMVEDHGHDFTVEGEENAWTISVGNVKLTGWLPVDKED